MGSSAFTTLIDTTRRAIPRGWLIISRGATTYRLRSRLTDSRDIDTLRAALKLAQRAHKAGEPATAIRLYREALDLRRTGERADPPFVHAPHGMAMMCRAELSCRSPALDSRCRLTSLDEASSGATPQ